MGNVIAHGYAIGKGVDVARVIPSPSFSEDQSKVLKALTNALKDLVENLPITFMPEVGINIGFAIADAQSLQDVCALEGRLVRVGDSVDHLGTFRFGASKHIARIILTAMSFDKRVKSAMNIKYDEKTVDACTSLGFSMGNFDRSMEDTRQSTMEWGTMFAIKQLGQVPDIIYDNGGFGKEAMIRILGKDPSDVVRKLKMLVDKRDKET